MPRLLNGEVRLPADAPSATAAVMRIEIRDTSLADAPSVLVAAQTLRDVPLHPGGTVAFSIEAPDAPAGRALSFRIHISLTGAERVQPGDLLTTETVPVPEGPRSEAGPGQVAVAVVR